MKVKNLNNSAIKTKKAIRKAFAEILGEKKQIDKITVTELTGRAEICRATFYAHYSDVYAVAEDYENELIDRFFTNSRLSEITDCYSFIDDFFAYISQNQDNYALICRSANIANFTSRIAKIAKNKFYELSCNNPSIVSREHMELEISVVIDGIVFQYIKYCRKMTSVTIDEMRLFAKNWCTNFIVRRQQKSS